MPSRKGPTLLVAIAVAIFLFNAWRHGGQLVDDAYIALRYARNLVEGHGLVYNPGERVEGYTSIAFVLIAALCLKIGIAPIAAWKAVSLSAAVATLAGAARLEGSGFPSRGDGTARAAATAGLPLSPILLLPIPAFAYWSFGTLEAMVYTAFLVWGVALGWREVESGRFRGSAVAFTLATLTRPEGAPLFAVATLALALAEWRLRRPDRRFLRRHLINVAAVSAVFGSYLAWRLVYYGDWRPNTFYAKVTGGPEQLLTGLQYLQRFLLAVPLLAAAALALPVLLHRSRTDDDQAAPRDARRRTLALASVIAAVALAEIAMTVGLGGDSQPFHRFFVAALPLLAVLASWSVRLLLTTTAPGLEPAAPTVQAQAVTATTPPSAQPPGGWLPRRLLPAAAIAIYLLHIAVAHLTTQPYVAFVADRTTRVGSVVGSFFRDRLAPDQLIATNTAGSLPYASERPTLDMLGLADPAIARRPIFINSTGWAGHRRGWGEYVLRRRPWVVLFYNTAGARDPFYLGDRELDELPGFRFYYRLKTANLPPLEDSIAWPAARYPGFPFGTHPSGLIVSPDLGLEARFHTRPVRYTVFAEGPITVTFFERDHRDDELWEALGTPGRGEVAAFVEAVAERWLAQPRPAAGDPEARARVEAQCDLALSAIERGDLATARSILAAAAAANGQARSPRVFRYVANLAAMTGDLHTALAAEKELLRLEPGDALTRHNLASLLGVPSSEFGRGTVSRPGS